MSNTTELTNEANDLVMPRVNAITQIITTDRTASNDEVMVNGQPVSVGIISTKNEIREDGVFHGEEEGELDDDIKLSDPCLVLGYIEHEHNKTLARLIYFKNLFDEWRTISIPMTETSGNPKRLVQILTSNGLYIDEKHITKFYDYFIGCKPIDRFICIDNPGWKNGEYVIPECSDAMPINKYINRPPKLSKNQFKTSGTLIEWKNNVASMCVDNSRLLFVISVGFGSILMPLLGGRTCGFHLCSQSSRGKTTALKTGKSAIGKALDLVSWRSTDNALEAIAAEHNHSLLCLDESAQMAESGLKKWGDTIYMFGNEEGKSRYKMSDELKRWQLYYLSSGESSVRDTFLHGNKSARAGHEVRLVDISADTGSGYGIFDTVHGFTCGGAFADELNRNVDLYYGTAGRAFIKELTENMDEWVAVAQDLKREFLSSLDLSESDPQVRRVADQIAIIVAAGELASQLDITGWEDGQVAWAGKECFKSWIAMRGGEGSQEADVAVTTVQNKLIQYGHSKFITAENPTPRGQYWGKREGNNYFIFTDVFNNIICKGMSERTVKSELVQLGYITQGNDGRNSITKRIDGNPTRCIHINETLFGATTEDDALTNPTGLSISQE